MENLQIISSKKDIDNDIIYSKSFFATTEEERQNMMFDENNVIYRPISSLPSSNTIMPIRIYHALIDVMKKILLDVVDFDEYIIRKLKYEFEDKLELAKYFSGEQIDALTLIIYSIENKESLEKSFILSDMTGIGKGRVVAGIMRYAYQNNKIPIFITYTPKLYSDIMRDISDIGGIKNSDDEIDRLGYPFTTNSGLKTKDTEASIYWENKNGDDILISKPYTNNELYKILKRVEKGKLPKDKKGKQYDMIFSVYSQVQTRSKYSIAKQEFLDKYIENSILILDESHKASGGESTTGLVFTNLVKSAYGVLFSSATFSKTHKNLNIYLQKSSIRNLEKYTKEKLESLIYSGGNVISEYITSLFVKNGEMIRRERTFANTTVEYLYDSKNEEYQKKLFNNILDKTRDLLLTFSNSGTRGTVISYLYSDVRKELGVDKYIPIILNDDFFDGIENFSDLQKKVDKNRGCIIIRIKQSKLKSRLFKAINSMIYSVKSQSIVDYAIDYLMNDHPYNAPKRVKKSKNRTGIEIIKEEGKHKPIIAIDSTLESALKKLNKSGISILEDNDYSYYLLSLAQEGGTVEYEAAVIGDWIIDAVQKAKRIIRNIKYDSADKFVKNTRNYTDLLRKDFKEIDEVIENIKEKTNIPLSPIDFIIEKLRDRNINVNEITGRTMMLSRLENGKYEILPNKANDKKYRASKIKTFNNNPNNVLIINSAGSTGISLHSSPNYKDTNPRVMIFMEIDLKIDVQIQKRGRIYRTGQLNYPTYLYIVSSIPAELRQLVVFKKKLSVLDANSSANQKQSKEIGLMQDRNGNEIEDIINKYGDRVCQNYLAMTENEWIVSYLENLNLWVNIKDITASILLRYVQLLDCDTQKQIIDDLNIQYKEYVDYLKQFNQYDLETKYEEYFASEKNIVERISISEFDNLYEGDYYIKNDTKILTLEEVMARENSLLNGKDKNEYMKGFIDDFLLSVKKQREKELQRNKNKYDNEIEKAKQRLQEEEAARSKDKTPEEKEKRDSKITKIKEKIKKINDDNTNDIATINRKWDLEKEYKLNIFKSLKPDKSVKFYDGSGSENYYLGRFVGYKFISQERDYMYGDGNIEFHFAMLHGVSYSKIKLSANKESIDTIIQESKRILPFEEQIIQEWNISKGQQRSIARIFTGNLLLGMSEVNNLIKEENNNFGYSGYKFVVFNHNTDPNKYTSGIRVFPKDKIKQLSEENVFTRVIFPNDYLKLKSLYLERVDNIVNLKYPKRKYQYINGLNVKVNYSYHPELTNYEELLIYNDDNKIVGAKVIYFSEISIALGTIRRGKRFNSPNSLAEASEVLSDKNREDNILKDEELAKFLSCEQNKKYYRFVHAWIRWKGNNKDSKGIKIYFYFKHAVTFMFKNQYDKNGTNHLDRRFEVESMESEFDAPTLELFNILSKYNLYCDMNIKNPNNVFNIPDTFKEVGSENSDIIPVDTDSAIYYSIRDFKRYEGEFDKELVIEISENNTPKGYYQKIILSSYLKPSIMFKYGLEPDYFEKDIPEDKLSKIITLSVRYSLNDLKQEKIFRERLLIALEKDNSFFISTIISRFLRYSLNFIVGYVGNYKSDVDDRLKNQLLVLKKYYLDKDIIYEETQMEENDDEEYEFLGKIYKSVNAKNVREYLLEFLNQI